MINFNKRFKELAKKIAFRYTKLGSPTYAYCLEPIQLASLVYEFERLKQTHGNIVEIGVARGMTTRFMAEHIINQKFDRLLTYFAIDTFDSFLDEDLIYEVSERGKVISELTAFDYNNFEKWKQNFSDFSFIKAIKSDCAKVDFSLIGPIKIALLDVDLYLPTKKTLYKLYDVLAPGGVILVDDVRNNCNYDGAYQAYMEFCSEKTILPEIIGNKCGVLRKK